MSDNDNSNYTEGFSLQQSRASYIVLYFTVTGMSSVIGICGNLLTIITFVATSELQQTRNSFIVNLAVADLLVTGIVMPYSIYGVIKGQHYFELRPSLCRFLATICAPGCLASMYTICWISCSRCVYICNFGKYDKYFSKKKTAFYIASIWIACFLVHFPNHVGWGDSKYSIGFQICTLDMETLSYSFFYGCCMIGAMAVTFYFYFKIYQTVRKSNLARKMITTQKSTNPNHKHGLSDSQFRSEIRLAKTSFKIFIIFICTWTPTAILILIGINKAVPNPVYLFSVWMAHSNSMLNFFIYYVDNKTFRNGLKNIFMKFFCGKSIQNAVSIFVTSNSLNHVHSTTSKA